MLLADMGADVVVIGGGHGSPPIPAFARGKRYISLDLKSDGGKYAFRKLVSDADILIESNRPGVMKRLGADYDTLKALNSRLIFCSLTGYGQTGELEQEAGHDINYLSLSGALGAFGPMDDAPSFPLNLLADFAGGSLFAVIAILAALQERARTGAGRYIDAAMVDGCLSLMTMHFSDWGQNVFRARGDGLLAGSAPFYRCYRCSDGRFVAVGALEAKFFANLWTGLGLGDVPHNHLDRDVWRSMEDLFTAVFATRTRDEWARHFVGRNACVTPVLTPIEALEHPHNVTRHGEIGPLRIPALPYSEHSSKTLSKVDTSDKTSIVLREAGLLEAEIARALEVPDVQGGLSWPPM